MKYITILTLLLLAGCTTSEDHAKKMDAIAKACVGKLSVQYRIDPFGGSVTLNCDNLRRESLRGKH